jgi:hypothetical protein
MMLEDAIREHLLAVEPLLELLAINSAFPGIYAMIRPQSSPLPSVLISRSTTERQTLFCGTDTLVATDIQIDSYAGDGAAFDVAKQVRLALLGFTGTMGTDPGVAVDQVRLVNEFPLTDPDPGVIRQTQLYSFWYQEDL